MVLAVIPNIDIDIKWAKLLYCLRSVILIVLYNLSNSQYFNDIFSTSRDVLLAILPGTRCTDNIHR